MSLAFVFTIVSCFRQTQYSPKKLAVCWQCLRDCLESPPDLIAIQRLAIVLSSAINTLVVVKSFWPRVYRHSSIVALPRGAAARRGGAGGRGGRGGPGADGRGR